jgi:hypothetical protein
MLEAENAVAEAVAQDRPLPWRCPRCRNKSVQRVTMPYQCERRHENRIITVSVPALQVPQCTNCGELVFDYLAEAQINEAFRSSLK